VRARWQVRREERERERRRGRDVACRPGCTLPYTFTVSARGAHTARHVGDVQQSQCQLLCAPSSAQIAPPAAAGAGAGRRQGAGGRALAAGRWRQGA